MEFLRVRGSLDFGFKIEQFSVSENVSYATRNTVRRINTGLLLIFLCNMFGNLDLDSFVFSCFTRKQLDILCKDVSRID